MRSLSKRSVRIHLKKSPQDNFHQKTATAFSPHESYPLHQFEGGTSSDYKTLLLSDRLKYQCYTYVCLFLAYTAIQSILLLGGISKQLKPIRHLLP